MRKIVDYKIIHAHTLNDLERKIISYVEDGWQPYGFPHFTTEVVGRKIMNSTFQTIVRYEGDCFHEWSITMPHPGTPSVKICALCGCRPDR